MAEKIGGRWQEEITSGSRFEGLSFVITRKGVEVFGWYDSFVGIEPLEISWDELEQRAERVRLGKRSLEPHPD